MKQDKRMHKAKQLWATILAGGIGSRFWPASTPERPKQLLPLAGKEPLIETTVERARALVPANNVRIICGPHLAGAFRAELAERTPAMLIEPMAKGTAPALAWAAHEVYKRDPEAILISLHADHVIRPLEGFADTIERAARIAQDTRALVTIGVRPDRPETGYGYIECGEEVEPGAARVSRFREKPTRDVAETLIASGALWNSGIFVWRADVLLDELRKHSPEVGAHLNVLERDGVDAFFAACSNIAIDVALLERSRNVSVVTGDFTWDDVGSWEAVARTRDPDHAGNTVVGEARVVDGSGNIVWSEDEELVVWGVDNLIVARANGRTLIMPRHRAPDMKDLLGQLR